MSEAIVTAAGAALALGLLWFFFGPREAGRAELRGRDLASTEFSRDIAKIFDVLRRHRVQARGHMTMVNLALMTAEGLGKRLDPSLVLAEAALPYLIAGAQEVGREHT